MLITQVGTIPQDSALQAFLATVGPLPGVPREPGAVDASGLFSDSGPLRWTASYLHTLTLNQRRVFQRLISDRPPTVRAHGAALPSALQAAAWAAAIKDSLARLKSHFALTLTIPVKLELLSSTLASGAYADTIPTVAKTGQWASAPGPGVVCRIRVFLPGWQHPSADRLALTSAHELTHCFEFQLGPSNYRLASDSWLIEGAAMWAGDQVALEKLRRQPADPKISKTWDEYLTAPAQPLFSRSYSAVGFFAHLAETGVPGLVNVTAVGSYNIWPTLREMFKADGDAAAFNVGAPDTNAPALNTWAPGFARDPSLGSDFDMSGPGITATKPTLPKYTVSNGRQATVTALPRSSPLAQVEIGGDVVELSSSGGPAYGVLRDSHGARIPLGSASFCVEGAQCTCPAGTAGAGLPAFSNQIGRGTALLGVAATTRTSQVTLRGRSIKDWCQKPGPSPCQTGNCVAIALKASGAVAAIGTEPGQCSLYRSGDGRQTLQYVFTLRESRPPQFPGDPGQTDSFSIGITNGAVYTGPGTYTFQGAEQGPPQAVFGNGTGVWTSAYTPDLDAGDSTDPMGIADYDAPGDAPYLAGALTVYPGESSGAVSVAMSATKNSAPTERVSGRFSCALTRRNV